MVEGGLVEGFGFLGVLENEVVEGEVEFFVPGGLVLVEGFLAEVDGLGEVGLGGGGFFEGEVGEGADVVVPVAFGVEVEGAGDGGEGGLGIVGEEVEFGFVLDGPAVIGVDFSGAGEVG
ncbi:MAG: hypothetical protein HC771_23500 [Synechococcales cyanobacterium CRU_2_2]|nr:hypothetical protein [Synechococcales cyanobacterium CRU_2_2]